MPRYSCPLKAPLLFFWMYPCIKGVREKFGRVCVCVHILQVAEDEKEKFSKISASKTCLVSKTRWIFKLKHTVAYQWILLAILVVLLQNLILKEGMICGVCMPRQHTGGFSFISKVGFDYNKTFKWNAKNQTLGWTICLAFPTAAVKIKGIKITQLSTHSLFFVRFYVFVGWWGGLMLYYEPARQ